MTALGHWPLINRIRDSGNLLTLEEKQRMHNLVLRYKRTSVIFAADLQWLAQADESIASLYEILVKSSRRKGGPQ
jgi:hypothetical protein